MKVHRILRSDPRLRQDPGVILGANAWHCNGTQRWRRRHHICMRKVPAEADGRPSLPHLLPYHHLFLFPFFSLVFPLALLSALAPSLSTSFTDFHRDIFVFFQFSFSFIACSLNILPRIRLYCLPHFAVTIWIIISLARG